MSIDELKDKIGVEWEPLVYEIEKGMIQRFVQAIDDPNPLWQDEEHGRKSRYGGIIAPPNFIATLGYGQFWRKIVALLPDKGILHGGAELEFYQPVRAGDKITVTAKIADIRERQGGKSGSMAFVTFDIAYRNQRQELVAKCQQMVVGYEAGEARYG